MSRDQITIAQLVEQRDELLAALKRAEKMFRWYGDLHAAKEQTPENAAKTKRNYDEADACAAAIARAEGR